MIKCKVALDKCFATLISVTVGSVFFFRMLNSEDASSYLIRHMHKSLRELSYYLGRSIDDAVIVMHEVCKKMRVTNVRNMLIVMIAVS